MRKLKENIGVSLINIIIAIVVIIILTQVVLFFVEDDIPDSKTATLNLTIRSMKVEIETYIQLDGDYPVKVNPDGSKRTFDISTIPTLKTEIDKSIDAGDTFYVVDLKKIGAVNPKIGVEKTPDDVFIVAQKSRNVYYAKGERLDGSTLYHGYVDDIKVKDLMGFITFTSEDESKFEQQNAADGTDFINGEILLHKND